MSVLGEWRFCPRCGEAIDTGAGRASCPACGFVAYAHSAPTASALVTDGSGRLLLARRAVEPHLGRWDVPGGFLEEGEHPLDGLRRELEEEAGLAVEPGAFVGVWIDRYGDDELAPFTLNLFWRASLAGGEPRPGDDVSELRWFEPDELPAPPELAFGWVADVLRAWREQG